MLRITQIKLPIKHTEQELRKAIGKALKISPDRIEEYRIIKKSIDARKKEDIKFIYTIDLKVSGKNNIKENEEEIRKHSKNPNVSIIEPSHYSFIPSGTSKLDERPIIVGMGPAGLFCALLLARHGYQPILMERGASIPERVESVEHFWKSNELNPENNVPFGEGGAGTFSDGKLNSMVKDVSNRFRLVLETFVEYGAPSEILYLNKPHIGTDQLRSVVVNMRKEIIRLGGEIRFHTKLTDLMIENGGLQAIEVNHNEIIPCKILIAAIGHSARDTFAMFLNRGLSLSPKPFAIGLRIQHRQDQISKTQYGDQYIHLPPADYKLTHQTKTGRGVYSFCMCPGGFVVNASSEKGHLVVNGMSNHARDEENANSAIVVTVKPEDFGSSDPLGGIAFQRKWEKLAYETGKGSIPIQLYGDLLRNKESVTLGSIKPIIKGQYRLANLHHCLPKPVLEAVIEGIEAFDKKINGFADEEAILAGVESRTSSPVRIHRNEQYESNIRGIYPCGEGAGYAGGITSAAIDGIRIFEAIANRFQAKNKE
ncbi:MAG TPA: FAD-dependent oxidoreductase [Clostridiales bacterium]|nr:FAD-dependent oxidoreductase [Clostridiales bacterium]